MCVIVLEANDILLPIESDGKQISWTATFTGTW